MLATTSLAICNCNVPTVVVVIDPYKFAIFVASVESVTVIAPPEVVDAARLAVDTVKGMSAPYLIFDIDPENETPSLRPVVVAAGA